MKRRLLEQLSRNYNLVILVRKFTSHPQIIFVNNYTREIFSHEFIDLVMFLNLGAVFKREFKTSSNNKEWIAFWVPRKYEKGLKYLLLSLKELNRPSMERTDFPSYIELIENFKKHKWVKLERDYITAKLAQALKKKK